MMTFNAPAPPPPPKKKKKKKSHGKNIVGKGENAGNQHFLLFPQCVLPYQGKKLKLSSANAFNLDKGKIFVVCKGFKTCNVIRNNL